MAISIALIILLGLCGDYLFRQLKLPGLVGMLLVGILIGPYVLNLMAPEMIKVSGDFRKIALIVILLRAGFELRRDTLNRVGRAALTISAVPAVFEIAGVVLVAPHLLGMTYLEAALLGAILGAVSPAVVVPLMIDFMDRGRGTKKGIPTLILGASSVDDVFVIVLFSAFLGMYGGVEVNLWLKFAEIPVSILLGIVVGVIPGYFLYRLFMKYDWRPPKRTIVVMGVAIFLTWLEQALESRVAIASLLGVMAIGFVILEKSEAIAHIISQKLKKLWVFAELLLFVLVGAQVNIHVAWKAGIAGLVVISVGLLFRSVGTYISLFGANLSWKEKLFCVVAYIPKATVQAAIGPIGIMVLGEKILDHGERSSYMFNNLRESMGLPRVGERIRSKEFDTIWKVIEEKETWIHAPDASGKGRRATHPVPAVSLRYWKEDTCNGPGIGKTLTYRYSQMDTPFDRHWEILYDW